MAYSLGNALCSWAELGCACACEALGCVSRQLRYSQTTYVDGGQGIAYSSEVVTCLAWPLDSVSSLLLGGFFSELEWYGQIGLRTIGWR
jgi:hypothetical protein